MELSQATSHTICDVDEEQDQDPQHRPSTAADHEQPSSSSTRAAAAVEKEHMFDKVVTPSDVGKLNRLVIPKQHAEKHFPLDTAANEKGLLLNFEDRAGKPWRFRYSYWNSSQSYVMTKGWSRFVKDKRLDAGDTVSFSRGRGQHAHRLFIDWKRRPDILHHPQRRLPLPTSSSYPMLSFGNPWAAGRLLVPPNAVYDAHRQSFAYNACAGAGQYLVFRSPAMMQPAAAPMVLDSVPVGHGPTAAAATSKRVRLFGVNLDPPDCGPVSSTSSPSPRGKEKEELSLDLDM